MNFNISTHLSAQIINKLLKTVFVINSEGKVLESYGFLFNINNIQSLLHSKDWHKIKQFLLAKSDDDSSALEMEIEISHHKESRWYLMKMGAVEAGDEKDMRFFMALQDIQMFKLREESLRKEKERAEAQEKIKSSFLANMSHEIRTPMSSIVGFAELSKTVDNEEERQQYLNIIKRSGEHLLNIINDIIDISKIESGMIDIKIQRMDLNDLIDELVGIYQSDSRLNTDQVSIIANKNLSNDQVNILSDRTRLRQILSNLIDNAVKFTTKGKIEIGYELIKKADKSKTPEIRIYVKDTGQGIPKSQLELIFDRYHQVREMDETKGSGLGLSIVDALVSKLGGKIEVKSKVGKGSEFSILIPYLQRRKETEDISEENNEKSEKPYLKGRHILIAEDVSANFKFISSVLKGTQAKLSWVKNGKDAVQAVLDGTKFDLVLMDLQMPVMNGYIASGHIKTIQPKLPIIALTAYAVEGDMEKALEAGCDDYLSKPVSIPDLFEKLRLFIG